MKLKLTLTTAVLTVFSLSVLSQDSKEVNKLKEIKNDPAKYIEEGGVLPETKEMPLDSKEKKPEFVIHKSTSETEVERKIQYKTLDELNKYHDQTSSEYELLKEQWIKENKSLYEKNNPEVPAEKTMSPEDRKKQYNSIN
ncbi:hypothetical protein N9Y60_02015 [Crocinitomicaceae bacterium]|nr:hypothetical protein [Crocinitomicaceae bacterium]